MYVCVGGGELNNTIITLLDISCNFLFFGFLYEYNYLILQVACREHISDYGVLLLFNRRTHTKKKPKDK